MRKSKIIIYITLIFTCFIYTQAQLPSPVKSKRGMVASATEFASEAGIEILKSGGNAIDAAIAIGFALAVTYPNAGNIGGGGFMLVCMPNGETFAIDYRETAPMASHREMYLDQKGEPIKDASVIGYKAVGTPGTVAGFELAHQKFGKLKWEILLEPAIKLAKDGFPVSSNLARQLRDSTNPIFNFSESRRIFHKGNNFYNEGEILKQPDLAQTLKRIQKYGAKDFYEGKTAHLIVKDIQENGGIITLEDLKNYKAKIREPLVGIYRNYKIITMPPPSSGGTILIEMLNILENFDLKNYEHNSSRKYHLIIEAMKRAFYDRAKYFGDPDFIKIPVNTLISKEYAYQLAHSIDTNYATPSSSIQNIDLYLNESHETTHFTVVDENGIVVVNTYTLNGSYGCGAVVKEAGFLLNNEMDDFTIKPGHPNIYGLIQGEANVIEPNKRPLSSMTPTIVLKDEKVYLALGSPGGPTIINSVLQVIINVIDHGMNLQQAINAPRIHHQWLPDVVKFEAFGLAEDVRKSLELKGHSFEIFSKNFPYIGDVEAIMIDPETKIRYGGSDFRNPDAKAIGY